MPPAYNTPPFPTAVWEAERWEITRQRRRLLGGCWAEDVQRRVLQHLGAVRAEVVGECVRSLNLFERVCSALASLYDHPPRPTHGTAGELPAFLGPAGLLARSGLWAQMQDVQRYIIGCRETILMLEWDPDQGMVERRVDGDSVIAYASTACPRTPHTLWELRWLEDESTWAWQVTSIRDPGAPYVRLYESQVPVGAMASPLVIGGDERQLGKDITQAVMGTDLSGTSYPYRWTQGARRGRPFINGVLYQAQRTGQIWNSWRQQEAVDAALDVATAWTFWMHGLLKAGWPQRWVAGGEVGGAIGEETDHAGGGRVSYRSVAADPTSVVELIAERPGIQVQVGQWGPGADVLTMADAIARFMAAVSQYDGLDATHVVRRTSNDAESAAALSIQRDGRREAQRAYEEGQRLGDLELLDKAAAIVNVAGVGNQALPEDDYRIRYEAIPLSGTELAGRRAHNNELIDRGRMSTVDAYLDEHPGLTRDEAIRELTRIAEENKLHGARPANAPPAAAAA